MPHFEDNPLQHMALLSNEAETVLDLHGMDPEAALQRVDAMIQTAAVNSCLIRFDGAREDGKETLFLPLGRHLLAERKAGRLLRCLPIPEGDGYYVELPSSRRREDID